LPTVEMLQNEKERGEQEQQGKGGAVSYFPLGEDLNKKKKIQDRTIIEKKRQGQSQSGVSQIRVEKEGRSIVKKAQ